MSVNLNVRRISDRLLVTLRRTPDVTVVLCDLQLDFDPENYERDFLAATAPARRDEARPGFERQRARTPRRRSSCPRCSQKGSLVKTWARPSTSSEHIGEWRA